MLMLDKNVLQIAGCERLLSLSESEIQILTKNIRYTIQGKNLRILEYGEKNVMIMGSIELVGIHYE